MVLLFGGLSSARLLQEGVDEGRLCFYRAAWGAFRAHPLLGTGLGTFDSVFPAFRQADCGPLAVSVSRAHNVYLQGLVELGLFFALFALALVGALFAMLLAGYRSRVRRRHVPVAGLGVVAWRVVGATLRPVEQLRSGAAEITGRAGAERLPVPAGQDEIHRLAVTPNDMLDRLAASRDRQRAFVADAAHELRSPLTNMRTELEVARRLGDDTDWPAVADDLLARLVERE